MKKLFVSQKQCLYKVLLKKHWKTDRTITMSPHKISLCGWKSGILNANTVCNPDVT